MSDEVQEVEEVSGSLEDDIRVMRAKNRKLTTEKKELEEILGPALEAQRRELLRDKGFDPASKEGTQIMKAMARGEIEGDGSNLVEVAESEFGYAPSLTFQGLSEPEIAYKYLAERGAEIAATTFSDQPPSDDRDIADAEARGDWDTARMLKANKLVRLGNDG